MTKVVNIYKEPYDIYIGRAGRGNDGYFGNPFCMDDQSEKERTRVLLNYRIYFNDRIKNDAEFKRRILELKGKTLGCFCAPKACHGDIIAEWLNKQSSEISQRQLTIDPNGICVDLPEDW